MKCHVPQYAMEFAKTLISSDQPELIEAAEESGQTTVDAVAELAFDFAVAFEAEVAKRGY